MQILQNIGTSLIEVGAIIVLALIITYILRRLDIPTVLGLILGGLIISLFIEVDSLFTDFETLKAVITELALAWIGYDIGNEIDLNIIRKKGSKFGLVLIGEAVGAFVFISFGLYFLLNDLGLAILLGAIGMATAPAATSHVLNEYKAEGELTQTVLFIIAFDDILAILFTNMALAFITLTSGVSTGIDSIVISIASKLLLEIILAIILGLLGTVIVYFLLQSRIMTSGTTIEWLLGTAILLIGIALYLETSVILTMFAFGAILKTLESRPGYEILNEHILKLEILTVPIVLLFFILIGLLMDIEKLLLLETLFIAISYFIFRFFGKFVGAYSTSQLSSFPNKVKKNLPLCLITQAGVAIGLAGLAFNTLIDLGRNKEADLIINIIGISVILAEIIGPFLVKKAIFRAGENQRKLAKTEEEDEFIYYLS